MLRIDISLQVSEEGIEVMEPMTVCRHGAGLSDCPTEVQQLAEFNQTKTFENSRCNCRSASCREVPFSRTTARIEEGRLDGAAR